ncbi:MAG: hypothetical protein MUF21_15015 [Gemmatimonadaceae bacterium]|nr:hypothetical protein [Gemmatimonadaceae bacterium]
MSTSHRPVPPRRGFLAQLAAVGAALGVPALAHAHGSEGAPSGADEPWLARLTGRHRVIIHAHEPADGLAMGWARNFLDAQRDAYRLTDRDSTVVIGLQGKALALLYGDAMWAKYDMAGALGFAAGSSNPFAAPADARPARPTSVAALQARGVIFLACGNSLRMGAQRWVRETPVTAERMTAWADEARANLLPGVEVVPALITTLVMAQERGCRYVYAG